MIKMIVFDMAGTTVNEHNVVYKTVQQAINEQGYPVTLEQVLAEGAGKEKLQAIKSVLETYTEDKLAADAPVIFERFKILLEQAYDSLEVTEQPNASALFEKLRKDGVKVVLNTGYQRNTAEGLIEKLGWEAGKDFDALVTASDVPRNRPHPDMILHAMQQFNIADGKQVVKVGDSTIDIEEGKNAGCGLSIGITTGAHTSEQLKHASPDYIIGDLMEILNLS